MVGGLSQTAWAGTQSASLGGAIPDASANLVVVAVRTKGQAMIAFARIAEPVLAKSRRPAAHLAAAGLQDHDKGQVVLPANTRLIGEIVPDGLGPLSRQCLEWEQAELGDGTRIAVAASRVCYPRVPGGRDLDEPAAWVGRLSYIRDVRLLDRD